MKSGLSMRSGYNDFCSGDAIFEGREMTLKGMFHGLVAVLRLVFFIVAACCIEGTLLQSLSLDQRNEKKQQGK